LMQNGKVRIGLGQKDRLGYFELETRRIEAGSGKRADNGGNELSRN
jgi:hypothetical protein